MNKKSIRKALNGGSYLSPMMARGRFLRAPEGEESGAGANNGGQGEAGNSGAGTSAESSQNNTGETFDPASFWTGPAPAKDAAPSGESAGQTGGESGTSGGGDDAFRTGLVNQLKEMKFGDPVFNEAIAGEINEGNYDGVQGRLDAMGRSIVQQSLAMQVQILRPFAEQLMAQVRAETKQTFDGRDNTESLERLFPAAKNPVMAKTIQPIYDQALKNAKGDREKAVTQTKEMLRFMAGESANDLNLEVAPRGQGDRGNPAPNINWLDELTGRG